MTEKKNPFTLSFGRPPIEYISRPDAYERIINTFTELPVTDQIFIIYGLRGTGKTVLFSTVLKTLRAMEDWIVIQLNTYDDMSESLYSELYYALKKHNVQISAEIGLPNIAKVSLSSGAPKRTVQSRIHSLLELADESGKKVLAAVDDISKNTEMKRFSKVFQAMIGDELPLYFLGTGIPENIDALQNVRDLTFLYRAPRILLKPLDLSEIAYRYQDTLEVSTAESISMAKITKGYSFAFQALGYIYWKKRPVKDIQDLMPEFDRILTSASYSKMWTELSALDRDVCRAIAATDSRKVKDIRETASMDSNLFNAYRIRLKERGMIDTDTYGEVSFTLPRFAEFVNERAVLYE